MADSLTTGDSQAAAPPQAVPQVEVYDLETRKKFFQDSQDLTENARKLSEQDRDYRDHKQWTAYELQKLRKRGQPPIVINRIARKVDSILGIAERGASDPRAYPRTPKDEDAAEVCTDTMRFVCDQNRYQRVKQMALENLVIEGMAGAEIIVEQNNNQIDVKVNRVRWEEIFYDPYSREGDFSDARFKGSAKWMDLNVVGQMFGPDAMKTAEGSFGAPAISGSMLEDRPKSMASMADKKLRRVVVVDMYCKHGDGWYRYVFCSGGDLVKGGPSPYLDEYGKPTCPIELQSLYVNRENERYGLVRGMLGPQDEINYRRSKLLHLTSTRQTYANGKSEVDVDKIKSEMSRPDGHLDMKGFAEFGKDFGVIPTGDMASGQAELLQEAKNEIELFGPNNSLQGRGSDSQSGKAWQLQQQAGMAEVAILYSAASDLDLRVYRQIWMRVKQFWTEERFIRVTDNENAYRFLTVNEVVKDPMGNPVIDPRTGQPAMRNRPSEMDVDIIVESSPDVINSQQEQFELLVKLHEQGAPIPMDAIIMASTIRDKKQIMDSIKQAQQASAPQPNPLEIEKLHQSAQTAAASARKSNADAEKVELENLAMVSIPPNPAAMTDEIMPKVSRALPQQQVTQTGGGGGRIPMPQVSPLQIPQGQMLN
jgi:hypothetical protein